MNKPPPIKRDYIRDPDIRPLKGGEGVINQGVHITEFFSADLQADQHLVGGHNSIRFRGAVKELKLR